VVGSGVASETEALLLLKRLSGFGDRKIIQLIRAHGSGVGALRAVRAQGGLFDSPAESDTPVTRPAAGIRALPITSPGYPEALRDLFDPPPLLFLKGREELLHGPAVAIVGARRATEGGRMVAEAMGRILAGAGITVLSGMALGIDGAAHRGALEVGGNTVAVMGSGLEVVYPRSHRALFEAVGARGLLLSEFLPQQEARPHHFPKRNRIIAALARAIVVVEAGERSGALITVDHGLDLGRDILAVPGSLQNPRARGTNALIRDGARLLPTPEAILEEVQDLVEEAAAPGGDGSLHRGADTEGSGPPTESALPPGLRPLWKVLDTEPHHVDWIARRARVDPGEALAGLSTLELLGYASRCPGMRFRRG
jgi:DNA processing protein